MSIIKNGIFTGKRDSEGSAVCCGDHIVTIYNNTEWVVEYDDDECGFIARSGSVKERLKNFNSKMLKKVRK